MSRDDDIRWYKGKWKVRIIQKSNVGVKGKHLIRNILVEALQNIPIQNWNKQPLSCIIYPVGTTFTTVPRLLWRHPKNG